MKYLLFSLLLIPFLSPAQPTYFTLTANGFASASDTAKNYVVLEHKDLSQSDLYNRVLLYLNNAYRSPKDVISKVENQSITISGYQPGAIRRNNLHIFNMDYSVNLAFKDGRIKISAPLFTLTTYTTRAQTLHVVYDADLGSNFGIWNGRGKLRSPIAKQDLETFFNNYVKELDKAITDKPDW